MSFAGAFAATTLPSVLRVVLFALCFRALPVVAYVLVTRSVRIAWRVGIALGFVGMVGVLRLWDPAYVGLLAAAYAYYLAAACGAPFLARCVQERRVTLGGTFALTAGVFFLLPLLMFPLRPPRLLVLVIGWDLMLAAYSYCVDVARSGSRGRLSDCLPFLLVNPVLVYAQRGTKVREPQMRWDALGRSAIGLVTMAAASCLASGAAWVEQSLVPGTNGARALLALSAAGALRFLVVYAQLSGLASLQIGLMRSIGHEIPERFDWPIFARDPVEFWRRWNTYMTGWLLRYVFWPLALRHRRTLDAIGRRVLQGVSVVTTFCAAGALHDAYGYALGFELTTHSSRAFFLSGLVVLLWLTCRGAWTRTSREAAEPTWFTLARVPALVLLWVPIISFFSP